MKILFAIQGSGNGHVSRARAIYPELCRYGNVDVLISGYQYEMDLPFPVKYKVKGMSLIFGKNGGVAIKKTLQHMNIFTGIKDIYTVPVTEYDLVVNDFEPITAWACKIKNVPCYALSHQSAVLHPNAPQPKHKDAVSRFVLKHFAPFDYYYGFHFGGYDTQIFPPVIRDEVQDLYVTTLPHYTVYLPAYSDEAIIKVLELLPATTWQVFSKHCNHTYTKGNITITPIQNNLFLKSLSSCTGALMGAGFEGPSEALFLGKKLLVIPMKQQYEQQCNAAALASLGVKVLDYFDVRHKDALGKWMQVDTPIQIKFPKNTAAVVVNALLMHYYDNTASDIWNNTAWHSILGK
jgi:uncharacterized protein (TIGR00661 family)